MRVVVDTNVLVSGLLNADGPPGLVVNRVLARAVTALYDSRMLAEYREVPRAGAQRASRVCTTPARMKPGAAHAEP